MGRWFFPAAAAAQVKQPRPLLGVAPSIDPIMNQTEHFYFGCAGGVPGPQEPGGAGGGALRNGEPKRVWWQRSQERVLPREELYRPGRAA